MNEKKSETQKLASADSAIEIMGAMRATRISRLAQEKAKPVSERDNKLIERLNKELDILREERHRMYQGDEKIKDKISTVYSQEMKEYFSGKSYGR